jgi:D-alanine-D-alanine ligase
MSSKNENLKIAVAYNELNGTDGEENIDFISEAAVKKEAEDVFRALVELGYQPVYLPIDEIENGLNKIRENQPDLIFNLCEGYKGNAHHEMHIASMWELMGIPYTGNTPISLGLAQNKVLAKKLFESKKIKTPMYQVYRETPVQTYLTYPLIAKPASEDASLGITQDSIIYSFDDLKRKVCELLEKYHQPVLVEKFIEGREFNVSVLGNHPPQVLPVSEINFSELEECYHITSYEAKWLPEHPHYKKTPPVCPAEVSKELRYKLMDVALQVYHQLMGRDYGRVDMRVDGHDQIYVLEYNPNPDISTDAGLARSALAAGLKYRDLIGKIVKDTLKRVNYGEN